MEWFDEKIPYLKNGNWLYKAICLFLFVPRKKLSYKELYLILLNLNEKALGEKEAKKAALIKILDIYKDLHGKLPDGVNYDE